MTKYIVAETDSSISRNCPVRHSAGGGLNGRPAEPIPPRGTDRNVVLVERRDLAELAAAIRPGAAEAL